MNMMISPLESLKLELRVSGPGRWVGIPDCTRPNVSEPTHSWSAGGRYRAVPSVVDLQLGLKPHLVPFQLDLYVSTCQCVESPNGYVATGSMLEAPPLTRTRRMPVVLGGVSCKPEVVVGVSAGAATDGFVTP